ncbi:MAG: hypothetical protein WC614_01535 [bacterium]
MWFECKKKETPFQKTIKGKRGFEVEKPPFILNCKECDNKKCRNEEKEACWVLWPHYKAPGGNKEPIGIFYIDDMVKPKEVYKEDNKNDPRGKIECYFRIFKMRSNLKEDDTSFWLPYWIRIEKSGDEVRFGQYSPMMPETQLVELITEAIKKENFFTQNSKDKIHDALSEWYSKKEKK